MKARKRFLFLLGSGLALILCLACTHENAQPFGAGDLMLTTTPKGMNISGIEGMEKAKEGTWRWMVGSHAALGFQLDKPREYVLRYAMNNPLPGQRIELVVNGTTLAVHEGLKPTPWLEPTVSQVIRFQGRKGANDISWRFSLQNHVGAVFTEADKRPLAQALLECKIYPVPLNP
jgi:hypothetical protein